MLVDYTYLLHGVTENKMTQRTIVNKLCGRPPQYAPDPRKLALKVVSESRVTWATSAPILVFLGLSVLDLGPIYATDRRQTRIIASFPLP